MSKNHVERVREFNRFYTSISGLLDRHILNSKYNLPEVRILFELYHNPNCTAKHITDKLNIDKGYFSRILRDFKKRGLTKKQFSKDDRRFQFLSLTVKGKSEFRELNETQNKKVEKMLKNISSAKKSALIKHMEQITKILSLSKNSGNE